MVYFCWIFLEVLIIITYYLGTKRALQALEYKIVNGKLYYI